MKFDKHFVFDRVRVIQTNNRNLQALKTSIASLYTINESKSRTQVAEGEINGRHQWL